MGKIGEVLKRVVLCASKKDLSFLPICHRKEVILGFSHLHSQSYNLLAETVQRNVLSSDWGDPDHRESLLNPKNARLASRLALNSRLACCVAGNMGRQLAVGELEETMEMLCGDHNLDVENVEENEGKLGRKGWIERGSPRAHEIASALKEGIYCESCGSWSNLPWVTPECCHLACIACIGRDHTKCPLPECQMPFQQQKPYPRPENPNPKWNVPQQLIELQPAYTQSEWAESWAETESSKVSYLLEKLKSLEEENKWKVEEVLGDDNFLPHKVILFSQFLEHISLLEMHMAKAGISFCGFYSPKSSTDKASALEIFRTDSTKLVLILDQGGAVGLDLSFVNHVFLMEPLWDSSVEDQVISRAWRLGACREIHVEVLAMAGTVEEHMLETAKIASTVLDEPGTEKELQETTKRNELLRKISLVQAVKVRRKLCDKKLESMGSREGNKGLDWDSTNKGVMPNEEDAEEENTSKDGEPKVIALDWTTGNGGERLVDREPSEADKHDDLELSNKQEKKTKKKVQFAW